ncbi:trimeric intracellular cation channel family protein [Iamia sp. SCSIO 61187]|uniref:trimeric intracellular cation channel family protein n=1 Tax=Iamia sp. SCSIO 61187 TaxID=2722752 RepID=UPI001C6359E0|nr:TRIC cation channel family protein [Iamia sp. SCSIO 61187]QYG91467.1 trimeric intracellular cation channel family protein [Iamia sp. SCSIO 61187]
MAITDAVETHLILGLNLAATFVFGFSGGLAAVRARLDVFGVVVLAAVVGLAGGITRDLLIGVPPETVRDGRFLIAAAAPGVVCFVARRGRDRLQRAVLVFDAVGLSLFCVTGATKALRLGLGPVQAVVLGAITGIGGGIVRDVLLREVPTVLRTELYAVPALAGAAVVAVAHRAGSDAGAFAVVGAAVCLLLRLVGLRYVINLPVADDGPRPRGEGGSER